MNSEQLYFKIEEAVRAAVKEAFEKLGPFGEGPEKVFSNKVSAVMQEGELIARGWGFDWVDGEGYPEGYYDAVLKGMQHNLKVESYPPKVREFYAQFF